MFNYFQQALTLLTPAEKKRVFLILALTAVTAVLQTLSVLSMMPFIVLLANPDALQTSDLLRRLYEMLHVQSYHEFLGLFGLFGILVLLVGNLAVAFEQWTSDRFLALLSHRIETLVLDRTIRKPYEHFVTNHSAKLADIVLEQVERVVDGVVGAFITIFGNLALAAFIVLMLLIVSFKTTVVTLFGLLAAYLIIFLLLKRRLESHGEELTRLSAKISTAVKETLDGIKEIKTRRAEAFFSERFGTSRLEMSKLAIRYSVMNFLPHYLLETVVLAGFVAVALYFVFTTADAGVSLAYLALYGIAIYRLIPALQGIFEGLSTIHHHGDAVRVVLQQCEQSGTKSSTRQLHAPQERIALESVTYRYRNADSDQLSGMELSIPAGSSVCFFGPSGSGKTTVLNLLAGLVYPHEGRVECDGIGIGPETIDSWRERIGYSPQRIYLFDDTLASNIAFGVESDAVDRERVVEVSRIANLHEFVSARLPLGYDTVIGEQGETLSGGQRQRVGIARTLYHDPDVLILDESFAGLDVENRSSILDNLFALKGKTLIFSSHEASIASRCDKVVVLEQGAVTAEGTFDELLARSPRFAQLATQLDRTRKR